MTTEEVGCLRSDVGRQKAEVGKEQGRDTRMCGDPKTWFPMRVAYQREMKVKTELDRLGIENFVPMRYRIVERRVDGTTELRRETNTNLTDDTNMRELRRETNTNLTDDTNMRELRRETNTNLTDDTNMRDHGDERTQMTRIKRIYGTTELRRELVPAISNLIFVRSTQERVSELKMSNEVLEPLRYMIDHTASREHAIMTVSDRDMANFMRVASVTDDSVMFLDNETVVGKEGKRVEIMGGVFEGVTGVIRRVKHCKRVVVELEGIASVAIAYVPAVLLKEIWK